MAKVVKEMPRPRHGSLYDDYLDGRKWRLTQGVDFTSQVYCVRLYLYQLCKRRNLQLTTRVDGKHLYVQATKGGAK